MTDANVAIIELCLEMDRNAERIYRRLARRATTAELADLWRSMSDDETRHVAYWQRLLDLARAGQVADVFDPADKALSELGKFAERVRALVVQSNAPLSPDEPFLIACDMEFYLVHPALGTLFHALDGIVTERSPAEDYDSHLGRLVNAFPPSVTNPIEMELIGETMRRLWRDNERLIRLGGMRSPAVRADARSAVLPVAQEEAMPPELAEFVRVWPTLDPSVREAIMTMVRATKR